VDLFIPLTPSLDRFFFFNEFIYFMHNKLLYNKVLKKRLKEIQNYLQYDNTNKTILMLLRTILILRYNIITYTLINLIKLLTNG